MVRLREVPRTAAFAWSPGATSPLLATGTKAGAVDADFSNETQLELWNLDLGNPESGVELQPVGSISADSRFHDIAWSQPQDDHDGGIIAGALESGALDLWDAKKLQTDSGNSYISRISKHTGAIKALQFNPFRHELLATSGAKGELYVTDLNNASNSYRLGTSSLRADDFEALDWNKKVPHILVTGSSGGFATVWDVKSKRESLTLNNSGRKAVSAIAWDPEVPTKLATATSNDQDPVILLWDLRNSNAPERKLQLHDQGILSLAWSIQDPRLLLSCGKDNRTICWNARTGEAFGEFPIVTNWTFQTSWNPRHPSLLATASFDGKIGVQTIQSTNKDVSKAAASEAAALDGADFFAKAPSQPQGAEFSLPVAPKWLERPVSATFGFGGKLVKVGPVDEKSRLSKVTITTFVADSAIGQASQKFEDVLQKGDIAGFCDSKIEEAETEEEKADWTVIETLISGSRKNLIGYLGFAKDTNVEAQSGTEEKDAAAPADEASFFDDADTGDNFLSNLAATKGAKTNNPFKIFTGAETDADRKITKALMLGDFDQALEVCLKEERLSDAFMIAICGGQKCIDKAQAAYFKRQSDGPNYMRLLASVVGKNLWDVVYNADIKNWKEVMATLCTFADEKEFPDLCEALGDRLEESIPSSADQSTIRKDASFCYLAGSKLQKVIKNWIQQLQEHEAADLKDGEGQSAYSIHAKALQDLIEKVTIFRQVTNFKDADLSKPSGWELEPLYAKYIEYSDVLASQGQLSIAERYLDLLPSAYSAAESAKSRVKQATAKRSATASAQKQAATSGATTRQRVAPTYPSAQPSTASAPVAAANPYAPIGAPTPASQNPGARQGYGPPGYPAPQQTGYQPPGYPTGPSPGLYSGGYQTPYSAVQPPPRATNQSPLPPPAATSKNLSSWNDIPEIAPKPISRRATPSVVTAPVANSYGSQVVGPPPPITAPYSLQQRATPPLPPPPKAGAARVTSPPTGVPSQNNSRPSSAALNPYSPSTSSFPAVSQPTIPRGPSPYQPPPAGGPSSSRYAPAPGSQPATLPGRGPPSGARPIAPPPTSSSYAPSPYGPTTISPAGPTSVATPPPTSAYPPPPPKTQSFQPPPPGPPPSVRSKAGPVQLPSPQASESRPGTAGSQKPDGSNQKHPKGDRSHIPASSQPLFEILNTEMNRVKAKAPSQFRPHVLDTEKRLNILFDHLNNEDLLKADTIDELGGLAQALQQRQYDQAQAIFTSVMTMKTDEGSDWMVGVKRLIQLSRATPV
ncbi:hypothetical protein EJ06DRAFT_493908 [Trichodelitschia bisporula]|uniref:Protein transport protein SEC31 n=1 Tax=Trichodelitschia bisporula TaxID=703511 RepID=A0A6G1HW25_9PEZI|nr:hypothetical protein EJ06DRAFT_493908 [Trichodelitschia bisporula]